MTVLRSTMSTQSQQRHIWHRRANDRQLTMEALKLSSWKMSHRWHCFRKGVSLLDARCSAQIQARQEVQHVILTLLIVLLKRLPHVSVITDCSPYMVKLCNRCQKEKAALKRPKTSEQVEALLYLPFSSVIRPSYAMSHFLVQAFYATGHS